MNTKVMIVIAVAITALAAFGVWWMTQQPGYLQLTKTDNQMPASESYDPAVLGTSEGVNATVDAEANRIDDELKAISETDFSASGLSNEQLGL